VSPSKNSTTGEIAGPLSAGDLVEVRSKEEILATLDGQARLDGLPFMPEMFAFCGRQMRVWKRAHKTCDTVNKTGGRSIPGTVHLEESFCDGAAHGGCEAACLIFWKEAWLKKIGAFKPLVEAGQNEAVVTAATIKSREPEPVYSCQATALPEATKLLKWWDFRQYLEDWTSGNVTLWELVKGASYVVSYSFIRKSWRLGRKTPDRLIALYDRFQKVRGGVPFPRKPGTIPAGQRTPSQPLGLKPGELVRIRTHREILDTLDTNNKNRGMYFDAEEVPYCGQTFRVRSTVSKIIDERTGKMRPFKEQSVILDGVYCKGIYSDKRMFCPRAIYSFWRENWVERVEEKSS
jgi:hypothetical protein